MTNQRQPRRIGWPALGMGAALLILACGAMAAEYYVTPAGAGDYGGTNWHNAYSNVQTAASLATTNGDRIYLQWGVYSNASQIVISNAAGLTIQGGCKGLSGGSSNAYSGTNSTLTKTGGVMRIVYACDSTVTLARVTVSGGYFSSGTNNGVGMYFTNCVATLTNCVVRDNTNACTGASYGGGLCAMGGSLTILDSAFHNNTLRADAAMALIGGGVAAINCPVVMGGSGLIFSNNTVQAYSTYAAGGGVSVTGGTLTVEGALFITNWVTSVASSGNGYGGAIYHGGSGKSATITGCRFEVNGSYVNGNATRRARGGGVYFAGAGGVIARCVLSNNTVSAYQSAEGGGLYASGLQSLVAVSNTFQDNRVVGGSQGGCFYVTGCSTVVVEECVLDGSGLPTGEATNLAYVSGPGQVLFLNSTVKNNSAGHGLYVAPSSNTAMSITNCLISNHKGNGLEFSGDEGVILHMTDCRVLDNSGQGLMLSKGTATLLNCLLARNVGDGIDLAAGTARVVNCTLADNGGWGFNRTGGTGTVVNSIAWDNGSGGIASNGSLWVDFSCLQTPSYGGSSNILGDPLFANVVDSYYLSVSGLTGQAANSPCLAAGSNAAAAWGLTNRTTRTDGAGDTNAPVDMGYHYTNGVADSLIRTITNGYVDAVNGSNAFDGLSWTSAWKTLTHALSKVAVNATINVATGSYNAASGEVFPLVLPMRGLTLAGSNSNPKLTVLDNGGEAGRRVLQAQCKGTVTLAGLTFRGGRFIAGENNGAGMKFQACAVTLTNCVVRDNTNTCTGASYGGGLYANGGSLTILDSAFHNNTLRADAAMALIGGGVAAINCPVVMGGSGLIFSNNTVQAYSTYASGGGVSVTGGTLTVQDATFLTNWANSALGSGSCYGGAIYHGGSGESATITGCRFEANGSCANGSGTRQARGGGICFAGAGGAITRCVLTNNISAAYQSALGGGLYASGLQSLVAVSNTFQDNRVVGGSQGGCFYVTGCSTVVVEECVLDGSGLPTGTAPELAYVGGDGQILVLNSTVQNNKVGLGLRFAGATGATLVMTNCLVVKNTGDGLMISAGTVTLVNCTLADNVGWGIARPTSAGLTVKNLIFWGNTLGGIGHNQNLALSFTDSQDGWAVGLGAGNFSADPLFVDAANGDYHEEGVEGSWHNGEWHPDARNSPCLDAGDPASDWSREPKPCGNRINIGAYGNTAEATRSLPKTGTVLRVW